MLICQMFHVGPIAAPHTMSAVPSGREEDRRDAEEPDVERPDPEIEQVAADQGAAAHPIFSSKLSIAMT